MIEIDESNMIYQIQMQCVRESIDGTYAGWDCAVQLYAQMQGWA
jgi:hypothetical protein